MKQMGSRCVQTDHKELNISFISYTSATVLHHSTAIDFRAIFTPCFPRTAGRSSCPIKPSRGNRTDNTVSPRNLYETVGKEVPLTLREDFTPPRRRRHLNEKVLRAVTRQFWWAVTCSFVDSAPVTLVSSGILQRAQDTRVSVFIALPTDRPL